MESSTLRSWSNSTKAQAVVPEVSRLIFSGMLYTAQLNVRRLSVRMADALARPSKYLH